jgi:hypothetical protein
VHDWRQPLGGACIAETTAKRERKRHETIGEERRHWSGKLHGREQMFVYKCRGEVDSRRLT